jgi:hypothetical protein
MLHEIIANSDRQRAIHTNRIPTRQFEITSHPVLVTVFGYNIAAAIAWFLFYLTNTFVASIH